AQPVAYAEAVTEQQRRGDGDEDRRGGSQDARVQRGRELQTPVPERGVGDQTGAAEHGEGEVVGAGQRTRPRRGEPGHGEQQGTGQQGAAAGERERPQITNPELADRVVARPEKDDQQQDGVGATIVHSDSSALPYQGRPTGPRIRASARGLTSFSSSP